MTRAAEEQNGITYQKATRVGLLLLLLRLAARLALAVCAWLAVSHSALGQNIQFTQGAVGAGLDNTIQIPVAAYLGRGSASLPVTLYYSSRVWRVGHLATVNNVSSYQTIAEAIYAEHSTSGWKTSLDLPVVEWPKEDDQYNYLGRPFCFVCESGARRFRVGRVFIYMPDGSTHELRQSDQPYEGPMIKTGDFYAVDGSRLRYTGTGATSGTLYMPDGSRYELGTSVSRFIDRNGNVLRYDPGARKWTDTMNRELFMPWPASPQAQEYTYVPPGFQEEHPYRFIWKHLSETGVLTPIPGSQPPQPRARLPIANDYLPNPAAAPTNVNGNNYPQTLGPVGQVRPSLFVTDQASFDDTPTTVVGRGQSGGALFDPIVLAEVMLPNGLSYKFTYDIYGEIDHVVYPTGGSVSYWYAELAPAGSLKLPYSEASRAVSRREQILKSDGTTVSVWTYDSSNALGALVKTVAPDGSCTEVRKHAAAPPFNGWPFGFEPARQGLPYDERVYDRDPALSGALMLRRALTEYEWTDETVPPRTSLPNDVAVHAYRNARATKSTSLILDTGGDALAKTVRYFYDPPDPDAQTARGIEMTTGLDRTRMEETQFASVDQNTAATGVIDSVPAGAVASKTATTYLNDWAYRSRNFLGLVTSVTLFDAASQPVSKTETFYDEPTYAVLPPYNDLGTDGAYEDPGTPLRANPTTVRRYSDIASNSYLETHAQFDQYGNPVYFLDERGVQSQKEYSATYRHAYLTETRSAAPDPSGQYGSSSPFTSSSVYDPVTGLVTSTTDANGQTTTYSYDIDPTHRDPLNRLHKVTRPDGGWTKTYYNDVLGNLYVHTETQLDAAATTHAYQFFDGLGRAGRSFARELGANYIVTETRYDGMGRAAEISNPIRTMVAGGSDPAAASYWVTAAQPTLWTTTDYDVQGRVKKVTLPDGTYVTTEYVGVYTTVTDQAGRQRRQKADALGHVIRVDEPDTNGNLDPSGVSHKNTPVQPSFYEYDVLGNVIRISQGLTQSGLNPESHLSYTQHRYFKYDALSRLTYEKQAEQDGTINTADPLTGNSSWSRRLVYDETLNNVSYKGMLTTAEDARHVVTTFRYDQLGRPHEVAYSDGTPTLHSRYDQARTDAPLSGEQPVVFYNKGQLTEVSTVLPGDVVETQQLYDFDLMGRTRRQRQVVGTNTYELRYAYNLGGGLVSERYPSGRVVSYGFDSAARLSGVSSGATTYASGMTYKPFGGLESITLGNGTSYSMSYDDARLQLKSVSLTQGAATLQRYDYKYGQVDMATGAVDETKNVGQIARVEGAIGSQRQWQQRLSYDTLGRLTSAGEYRGDTLAQSYFLKYGYDAYGNRYQRFADNPHDPLNNPTNPFPQSWVESGSFDAATNRLTSGVTYDDAGNVTSDARFHNRAFQYDANNRQKQSSNLDGTGAVQSVYDGAGQRVAVKSGGVITQVMVYDAAGDLVAEYGGSVSLNGTRYVMGDQQGSTRVVMTGAPVNGQIVASRHDYLPFGEEVAAGVGLRTTTQGYSQPDSVRKKYAGMEGDDATGMSHTLWREYDSLSARWTAPDPYGGSMSLASPQSFNRYSYVNNDPVNKVDLTGLMLSDIGVSQTTNAAVATRLERALVTVLRRYMEGQTGKVQREQRWQRFNSSFGGGTAPSFMDGSGGASGANEQEGATYTNASFSGGSGSDPDGPGIDIKDLVGDPEKGFVSVSLQKQGQCVGVLAPQLRYDVVNVYGSGSKKVSETAEDHIKRNHIDAGPAGPGLGKSRYVTDPPQGREDMFTQVKLYNLLTFNFGAQVTVFNKRGDVTGFIFVFQFPPLAPHPVYPNRGAGWIGYTSAGNTTLVNSLTLLPDCRTVTSSFPGRPY